MEELCQCLMSLDAFLALRGLFLIDPCGNQVLLKLLLCFFRNSPYCPYENILEIKSYFFGFVCHQSTLHTTISTFPHV